MASESAPRTRVRVVIGEMPEILRQIIEDTVRPQPDLELLPSAAAGDADVAVLGVGDEELPAAYARLMYARPSTRVLAITLAGGRGHLYELRPHRVPLGDVSPQGLLDAIRRAPCTGVVPGAGEADS